MWEKSFFSINLNALQNIYAVVLYQRAKFSDEYCRNIENNFFN